MSEFKTKMVAEDINDGVWVIHEDLIYESDLIGRVVVPAGFQTDFASVPRVPVAYWFYGGRAHHEAAIHDALYREDYPGNVTFDMANRVFLEAMECRGKHWYIRYPMYSGVCLGGRSSFHKRKMTDKLT